MGADNRAAKPVPVFTIADDKNSIIVKASEASGCEDLTGNYFRLETAQGPSDFEFVQEGGFGKIKKFEGSWHLGMPDKLAGAWTYMIKSGGAKEKVPLTIGWVAESGVLSDGRGVVKLPSVRLLHEPPAAAVVTSLQQEAGDKGVLKKDALAVLENVPHTCPASQLREVLDAAKISGASAEEMDTAVRKSNHAGKWRGSQYEDLGENIWAENQERGKSFFITLQKKYACVNARHDASAAIFAHEIQHSVLAAQGDERVHGDYFAHPHLADAPEARDSGLRLRLASAVGSSAAVGVPGPDEHYVSVGGVQLQDSRFDEDGCALYHPDEDPWMTEEHAFVAFTNPLTFRGKLRFGVAEEISVAGGGRPADGFTNVTWLVGEQKVTRVVGSMAGPGGE